MAKAGRKTQAAYLTIIMEPHPLPLASPLNPIWISLAGVVNDEATELKRLKTFHAKIVVDYKKVARKEMEVKDLPVRTKVTREMLNKCFMRIKREVEEVVNGRIEDIIK